jgi:hypothetical protein
MTSLNSRRKLKPRDAYRFAHVKPELFAELAMVICATGMLPQKELHECWQMANVVHKAFPENPRIADLAAGHGLLAWILVLLARSMEKPVLRTAVALDIKRPKSAAVLATAMTQRWPQLAGAVHFVEGSIDAVRTDNGPDTLFVAVHACGSLSDRVLMAAMRSLSPVAIMPCCHSLRKQIQSLSSLALASGLPELTAADMLAAAGKAGPVEVIDQFRREALSALGYQCHEESIQAEITSFHRIIIGKPTRVSVASSTKVRDKAMDPQKTRRIGEIAAFEGVQSLDLANIEEAQALSMRPSREWIRSFDLSFWVKDESMGNRMVVLLEFLMQRLSFTQDHAQEDACVSNADLLKILALGNVTPASSVRAPMTTSVALRDRYTDAKGRCAFTYRIEIRSSTIIISKKEANLRRRQLCLILSRLAQEPEAGFEWRGSLSECMK